MRTRTMNRSDRQNRNKDRLFAVRYRTGLRHGTTRPSSVRPSNQMLHIRRQHRQGHEYSLNQLSRNGSQPLILRSITSPVQPLSTNESAVPPEATDRGKNKQIPRGLRLTWLQS